MSNKIGWIASIVLISLVIALVLYKVVFPPPSKPTRATLQNGILEYKKPQVDIGGTIPLPTAPGNAGDEYAAAVDLLEANRTRTEEMYNRLGESDSSKLTPRELAIVEPVYEFVQKGTGTKRMTYTLVHTDPSLKVSFFADGVEELDQLAAVLDPLFLHYYDQGKLDQAAQIARAQFILGWHMTNERARVQMTSMGLDIQAWAIRKLQLIADTQNRKDDSQILDRYALQVQAIQSEFDSKSRIVRSVKPEPGDVFNLIENDQDRAWKTEGLLALGVLKFSAKHNRGDMRKLDKLIEKYADSDDPVHKAAAEIARDATKSQIETWAMGGQ